MQQNREAYFNANFEVLATGKPDLELVVFENELVEGLVEGLGMLEFRGFRTDNEGILKSDKVFSTPEFWSGTIEASACWVTFVAFFNTGIWLVEVRVLVVSLVGHVGEELVGEETGEKEINGGSPFSCWLTGLSIPVGIFELEESFTTGAGPAHSKSFDGAAWNMSFHSL